MNAGAVLTPGSISSIISSIVSTALNLGTLARNIANAPEHIRKLCSEAELCRTMVLTIQALLYQIETDGVSKDGSELIYVSSLAKALVGCQEALNSLEQEVERLVKENMKIGKDECVRWVWREEEIEKYLRSLEAHKITLNITLNVLNIQQVRELRKQNAQLLNCIIGIAGPSRSDPIVPQDVMRWTATTAPSGPSSCFQRLGSTIPEVQSTTESKTPGIAEPLTEAALSVLPAQFTIVTPSSANTHIPETSETRYYETILLASRVYRRKKSSKPKSWLLHSNMTWSELHISGASILSYRSRSRSSLPVAIALIKTRSPIAILSKNPNRLNDAFIEATRKQDIKAISVFLKYGANINIADTYKNTPLHSAASKGDFEIAKVLLAHGADINPVNKSFKTPLHLASYSNRPDIVSLLLQHGADMEFEDSEMESALWYAVRASNLKSMEILLEAGANWRKKNKYGRTVLHIVAQEENSYRYSPNNQEILNLLLQHIVDIEMVNAADETALFSSTRAGKLQNMKILLEAGADPRKKNMFGQTCLHLAAASSEPDAVEVLLQHGADTDLVDNVNETALFGAAQAGRFQNMKVLLQAGADPRRKNVSGKTPLHLAATSYKSEGVKLLLDHGLDIDCIDNRNETALFDAIRTKALWNMKTLFEAGADLGKRNASGHTPLHIAAAWCGSRGVKLLLHHGADVDLVDNINETPLFSAARAGQWENMRILLEAGVDPTKQNASGQTLLDVAGGYKRGLIIEILRSYRPR